MSNVFLFLVMLSLFLYALRFLWPNLQSLSLYHFHTQSLTYDLLNSASEIPNIRRASIAFKLFCNKWFLVSVFTMFMWLKNFSRLVFETVHINKFQRSKKYPSSLVCFYLGLRSSPQVDWISGWQRKILIHVMDNIHKTIQNDLPRYFVKYFHVIVAIVKTL